MTTPDVRSGDSPEVPDRGPQAAGTGLNAGLQADGAAVGADGARVAAGGAAVGAGGTGLETDGAAVAAGGAAAGAGSTGLEAGRGDAANAPARGTETSGVREPDAGDGPAAATVAGPPAATSAAPAELADSDAAAELVVGPGGVSPAAAIDAAGSTNAADLDAAASASATGADPAAAAELAARPAGVSPAAATDAAVPADTGRPGSSTVTLYDVARIAGVSTATVSRVVHNLDRVRDSTRARVLRVINELGYVPDGAAQSLSRRRKNVIGLVGVERVAPRQYDIESMSLLFYDEILRGVEQRIRDHNWSLLFTYLREESSDDLRRLQSLSGKVDGLLIGEGIVPPEELAWLAERLPVVVLAGDPMQHGVDVVTADNRSGSAALVSHLVETHARHRIFHVDGPPTAPDAKERRHALCDVIDAHPGVEIIGTYSGRFSVQSGEEAGQRLLADRGNLPDAIVCANDQMAIGVLQALVRGGVRVPEDVAVTGFDDIFPGSLFEPSLTTVHQPMRLLGERACARLLERIVHPDLHPRVDLLPTELVLRRSCGCPPGRASWPIPARTIHRPGAASQPRASKKTASAPVPAATAVTASAVCGVPADGARPTSES